MVNCLNVFSKFFSFQFLEHISNLSPSCFSVRTYSRFQAVTLVYQLACLNVTNLAYIKHISYMYFYEFWDAYINRFRSFQSLKAMGATKVSAYVTHGVFPKASWKRFTENDTFHSFWITDSLPQAREICQHPPFKLLSLASKIIEVLTEDVPHWNNGHWKKSHWHSNVSQNWW